jgi:hypothetical protein
MEHFLSGHTAESLVQIYAQFFVLNERTKHLYWYQAVCCMYERVVFPTCHMAASDMLVHGWPERLMNSKNIKSVSLWKQGYAGTDDLASLETPVHIIVCILEKRELNR